MAVRKPQRGMTIHRDRRTARKQDMTGGALEAGAALTIIQMAICVLVLMAVFTLQFFSSERYERIGSYYQAVMGGQEGEALFVGAFGKPLTKEFIDSYFDRLEAGDSPLEPLLEPTEEPLLNGRGGESPTMPSNVSFGPVVVSAKAQYPAYGKLTSFFGYRDHPISGKNDFHTGIDIAARTGDSIYAAYPGQVTEVGVSQIYGNTIRITHSGNLETVYHHCSVILAKEGAVVRAGERIAEVGSTGVSTGPHLHFDVLVNGNYVDPLELFQ